MFMFFSMAFVQVLVLFVVTTETSLASTCSEAENSGICSDASHADSVHVSSDESSGLYLLQTDIVIQRRGKKGSHKTEKVHMQRDGVMMPAARELLLKAVDRKASYVALEAAGGDGTKERHDQGGFKDLPPPWYILHNVTAEGAPKDMGSGSYEINQFTPAQQAKYGVDADGKVVDATVFNAAFPQDGSASTLIQTDIRTLGVAGNAAADSVPIKADPDVSLFDLQGWSFIVAAFVYTVVALVHEFQSSSSSSFQKEASKDTRERKDSVAGSTVAEVHSKGMDGFDERWDLTRLVLVWLLIATQLSSWFQEGHGLHSTYSVFPFAPWAMGSFVFLSGMFSFSLSGKPLFMTLAGLPCTLMLLTFFASAVPLVVQSDLSEPLVIGRCVAEWYLQCMFIWRLTLTPLFESARMCGVSLFVPFAGICVASYVILSKLSFHDSEFHFHLTTLGGGLKVFLPWHMVISNAPCFAAGLLFSPRDWALLLDKRSLTVLAYTCLAGCAVGVYLSPFFMADALPARMLMQKALVFAPVWVIASWFDPLEKVAPRVLEHLVGCGRRSLNAFSWHWVLFVFLGARAGAASIVSILLPGIGTGVSAPYVTSLWLTLALSCRFSELAFGCAMNLPMHLASCLSDLWEGRHSAEQKAFEAFEPINRPLEAGHGFPTPHVNKKLQAASALLLLHTRASPSPRGV